MSTAVAEPKEVEVVSKETAPTGEFGKAGNMDQSYIHLDQIFVDDNLNARKSYPEDSMEEMYESILANNGIYLSLLVAHSKPGSTKTDRPFTLVAGFRRAKGLMMVRDRLRAQGLDPEPYISMIPINILDNVDVENYHVVQLVENLVRRDLNPIEAGDAIERAITESKDPVSGKNITAARLAKQLGLSEAKVSQLRAISRLPEFIKEEVAKGTVSFVNARTIVAVPVPEKHYRAALKMARTMTGPEFEAHCRTKWGRAGETGAAVSGGEAGGQKARATRSAKQVREEYFPELKKRIEAAKGPKKEKLQSQLDGIRWMLMEEGTELGKELVAFEEARAADEQRKKEEKAQDSAQTRLLAQLTSLMRKHINRPLEEGQTKPTRDQALDVAMATVEKGYNKEKKTYPVAAGKSEQGKPVVFTDFVIPDLAAFKVQVLENWNAIEKKKKEEKVKKDNDKKAAEQAAARETAGQTEAAVTGVQTNVVDNSQGERAAGGMNKQNEGDVAAVTAPTAAKENAAAKQETAKVAEGNKAAATDAE